MMATAAQLPEPEGWRDRAVVVFNGQHDSRIKTGEDYSACTLGDIFALKPGNRPKAQALAFIPSQYRDFDARRHSVQRERGSFVTLAGDVDSGDHPIEAITVLVCAAAGEAAWLVYSTAHARPGNMRWRIIVPLAQPVGFEEWRDAQTALFEHMESGGVPMDWALVRSGQPIYLPNVPSVHSDTGTRLRDDAGNLLFYAAAATDGDAPGLVISHGPIAERIAALRAKREVDDKLREAMRAQAERRRRDQAAQSDGRQSVIDTFNATASLADLIEGYGYQQSPRNKDDWRSPNQTSDSYATRIMGGKWVSLSASDASARVGAVCASGCYGDAFDLFVHYGHGGDRSAAWRQVCEEQGRSQREAPRSPHNGVDPPWGDPQDPGWEAPPGECAEDEIHSIPGVVAVEQDWPQPVDLWAHYSAPQLPVGLLPDVIERFARKHGEVMGADPAGLAMAALTVCATAISDDIALQVKRNDPTWKESARLWVGLVGPPSRKKTPILKAALRPLRRLDSNLMSDYLAKLGDYEGLASDQRKAAPRPKQKRLLISDATIEAAQEVMKDSPDGIMSEQDELSGWFGAMDKYAPGKGAQADRAFWLKAFNGGIYNLNRISRGAVQIPNLSINLLGGIQPEPLRKIANDTCDDGLIERLLPVILRPASVGRDVPSDGVIVEYERLIEQLNVMKPPQRGVISGGGPGHVAVRFDDRARAIRERLEVEHLALVEALETVSPKLAAHYGKFDGLFARLCLLWHCIDNAAAIHLPAEISEPTAERVATFMESFIRPSAVAFYAGMLGVSAGHEELVALAAWIVAKGLTEVGARDAQRSTQSLRHLTADEVRTLCEKLESFGWLERGEPAPKSNTPRWIVNSRVHEQFGDRATVEQNRREAAREALRDALRP